MAELFPVPEVAAGATEVVVSEWLVEAGDSFKTGDAIAVVETDKAVVEIEAVSDATLLRILVEAGRSAEVGAPLALLGSTDEADANLDEILAKLGVGSATGVEAPARRDVPDSEAESPAPVEAPAPQRQSPSASNAEEVSPLPGNRVFISPIARKLLRGAGLSAEGITGSGPRGRIRRRDVESHIAEAATTSLTHAEPSVPVSVGQQAAAAATKATWTEIPHSRLRRAVARRLTESKQEVPHFYLRRTAVLDELLEFRARINQAAPAKVSVNDLIIRAIAVAYQHVPEANVIWTDDAMRRFDTVDVSVAIASERGLVTPVLRGVEKASLSAISNRVKTFVALANDGKLHQADLEGGSITISNLGMYGVDEFSAIINPPQSAILAVGAGHPAPVAVGDSVEVRTTIELVLSVDHRAIDGALAAQWMTALVDALHEPLRLVV